MRRTGRAHQDGAHRHPTTGGGFQHVVQNVGRIQIGADQQISRARQRAVFQIGIANFRLQCRVAVQLAIALDVGVLRHKQVTGHAHLACRGALGRAIARVRQESDFRDQVKALNFQRCHGGDLGQLFRARVFIHISVGDEDGALVGHQGVHGGIVVRASTFAQNAVNAFQMGHVIARQAANHGIGIAQGHHQGADDGVGATHCRLGHIRGCTVAFHQLVVVFPVLAKARVVFGIDVVHVHAQAHAQACFFDASGNHGGPPDQDRLGHFFINRHLRGTQGALVLAVGVGDPCETFWQGLGRIENGLHQNAGLRHKALQLLAVRIHVSDRTRGHTGFSSGLRYGRRDAQDQARVKRCRNDVVAPKRQLLAFISTGDLFTDVGFGQIGDLSHASELHGFGDFGCTAV